MYLPIGPSAIPNQPTWKQIIIYAVEVNNTDVDLPRGALSRPNEVYAVTPRFRGPLGFCVCPDVKRGHPVDILGWYISGNDFYAQDSRGATEYDLDKNRMLVPVPIQGHATWNRISIPNVAVEMIYDKAKCTLQLADILIKCEDAEVLPDLDDLKTRDGFKALAGTFLQREEARRLTEHLFE